MSGSEFRSLGLLLALEHVAKREGHLAVNWGHVWLDTGFPETALSRNV